MTQVVWGVGGGELGNFEASQTEAGKNSRYR